MTCKNALLDYLSQSQNLWVALRFKKMNGNLHFTTWRYWKDWKELYTELPNNRQILNDEIVLETDLPTKEENKAIAEKIAVCLEKKGYKYKAWFSGNKSIHFHLLFKGALNGLDNAQRTRAKKLWVKETLPKETANIIDEANLTAKHLILLEGALNPKSLKEKKLVVEKGNWEENIFPKNILDKATAPILKTENVKTATMQGTCKFIEWACENKLPVSCRNQKLVPNVVAYTQDKKVWQKCAKAQEKSLLEFEKWAERKPSFNCKQLQAYAGKLGKRSICDLCLLGGF